MPGVSFIITNHKKRRHAHKIRIFLLTIRMMFGIMIEYRNINE